ncbi:hypothetical protein RclHR1_05010023 [Rhizophagus clarus]|uniref:Zinc ribbon domain-containing protein n=1 Tax=Rhizophagus clarus TaxID=94130 RepID=A0A2Z6RQQ1_9GLOM|nr:hypothetical protein RclHR1_05010023 [Rhizophagus clarus]GES74295.1 zinc ribbon domain-containing protein [Rhizophagus clarus]
MFFFFVGSYAPKLSRMMSSPGRCPNCFTPTVYHYKVQHQLSIFFIPIWQTKSKYLWICDRCKWTGFSRPEEQEITDTEL